MIGDLNFTFLEKYWPYFLTGARNTIMLAIFTVLLGTIIGVIIALMRLSKSKIVSFIAAAYTEIIRGTPLMVQIFIIFYGLDAIITFPKWVLWGISMDRFIPGIIAMSLNSGAYVAEIVRSGIQSLDKGQTEAARSLGMTGFKAMWYIVLPQAIKNILPALGNEFVTVIKESSIVSVISVADLMFNTSIVRGATYIPLEPLYVTALIYFVMTFTTSKILAAIEKKMGERDDRKKGGGAPVKNRMGDGLLER